MDVIVTGCAGRLGSVVCRALVSGGHRVVGVDRRAGRSVAADGVTVEVEDLSEAMAAQRVFVRAREAFGREGAAAAADGLVHLAGHTNSHHAPGDVVLAENLALASRVFHGAMEHGVDRVVFSSSVQAFLGGMDLPRSIAEEELPRPVRLPVDEGHPARPTNTYGVSKLLTERMLEELTAGRQGLDGDRAEGRMSAVSLRLPYLLDDRAFEWASGADHRPGYRFSGPECFTYLHVEDAAALVGRALVAEIEGHEVVWACAPDPRSVEPVATLVERFYAGVPGGEAAAERDSLVDCSKARDLLGWTAKRLLREARGAAV